MKNTAKRVMLALLAIVAVALVVFVGIYFTRLQTMSSIRQLSDYADGYNLYSMDVAYDYDLDHLIGNGEQNDAWSVQAILDEALPLLPVHVDAPKYGCSCFGITDAEGDVLMGRNYDFSKNTSAMMVSCHPKGGYRSVGLAALDNVKVQDADDSVKDRLTSLTAPFICLDGINEKGVSIAVLTLDSDPTDQDTQKADIFTTLAIRLVLDRAATTQEAVDLLRGYDMHATAGRDYHFFINDASCDSRVVEWDCESDTRELVDTRTRTITNFFAIYKDKVKVTPDGKNGIYGHGRDRYDKVEQLLTQNEGAYTQETAWEALQVAQQLPKEGDVTSNTQWSIVFNNTDCTGSVALRRHWDDLTPFAATAEE